MSRGQTFASALVLIVLLAVWYDQSDKIRAAYKTTMQPRTAAK